MVLCSHALACRDASGGLEYYCSKFSCRMDLDLIERCRTCSEYCQIEG